MRILTLFAIACFISPSAFAGEISCPANALVILKNTQAEPEKRSALGSCLIASSLERGEVARAVLHVIKDAKDDLFLREELVEALASAPMRRIVKVEGALAPTLGKEEKDAIDRTLAGAGSLLAVTQAVKSMNETVPVSRLEGEFFRALGEIAQDESSHVLLRATAVNALEKLSRRAVESGIYDERSIRAAQETLRILAGRDDNASYFSGANLAYVRLADAGLPGYTAPLRDNGPARAIASVPEKH